MPERNGEMRLLYCALGGKYLGSYDGCNGICGIQMARKRSGNTL